MKCGGIYGKTREHLWNASKASGCIDGFVSTNAKAVFIQPCMRIWTDGFDHSCAAHDKHMSREFSEQEKRAKGPFP